MPAGALSTTLPPAQNVVGPPPVMTAVGAGVTLTVVGAEAAVQPEESLTVTTYDPAVLVLIDCVVPTIAPFALHEYVAKPAGAFNVTFVPAQIDSGPLGVIAGAASAPMATLVFALTRPQALLTSTASPTEPVRPAV